MEAANSVIAIFGDPLRAERAVKRLVVEGFELRRLSIVGKGYHTEEKTVGFYTDGDRIKFWGTRGAYWGGLWGLFFGGLFMTVPVIGHVVVLGYLAAWVVSAAESAILIGGISALGAAIYSIGVPKGSVLKYEAELKADAFLVMAHGTSEEMIRAKSILNTLEASRVDLHSRVPETKLTADFV